MKTTTDKTLSNTDDAIIYLSEFFKISEQEVFQLIEDGINLNPNLKIELESFENLKMEFPFEPSTIIKY